MGRRTVLLSAALVVAAVGTMIVFLYAKGADDRARADQELVAVLVAKSDISTGTTAQSAQSAGAFELREVAAESVVPGALSDIAPVQDQVVITNVFAGQQVLSQQFGANAASGGLPIPDGKMAVSVQLGDPERVAGFVQPGSEVAVFVTIENNGSDTTRLLIPRVEVIAAGPTTLVQLATKDSSGNENTEELPRAILTLAVDQKQAEKLIYGTTNGAGYFALLTEDTSLPGGGGVSENNLFS
jgi:pilus assembly protein CpaB